MVKGKSKDVRRIADALISVKGVKFGHLTIAGTEEVILGTGVDLAEVDRIRAIRRALRGSIHPPHLHGPRDRLCRAQGQSLRALCGAVRGQGSGMKALGTGWRRGIQWKDFEVVNLPSGRPTLLLHGEAEKIAHRDGREEHSSVADAHQPRTDSRT